jgi:GNAT superfamily N-acetyltransferase
MVANFYIRPVRSHEADGLYRRYRETALAAYAHIFPPEVSPFPDDDEREKWRDLVAGHGHIHQLFVADIGGDLAGAVVARPGTLERLFVVPSHWGTGVAHALHAAAIEIFTWSGCRTLPA